VHDSFGGWSASIHSAVVIGLMSFNEDNSFFGGWTLGSMDIASKAATPISPTERGVGNSLIRSQD
jgi:hypothetical protein